MGELIFALFIGGWIFFVGLHLHRYLDREEKRYLK